MKKRENWLASLEEDLLATKCGRMGYFFYKCSNKDSLDGLGAALRGEDGS